MKSISYNEAKKRQKDVLEALLMKNARYNITKAGTPISTSIFKEKPSYKMISGFVSGNVPSRLSFIAIADTGDVRIFHLAIDGKREVLVVTGVDEVSYEQVVNENYPLINIIKSCPVPYLVCLELYRDYPGWLCLNCCKMLSNAEAREYFKYLDTPYNQYML